MSDPARPDIGRTRTVRAADAESASGTAVATASPSGAEPGAQPRLVILVGPAAGVGCHPAIFGLKSVEASWRAYASIDVPSAAPSTPSPNVTLGPASRRCCSF